VLKFKTSLGWQWQVGPAAGPKAVWWGLKLFELTNNYYNITLHKGLNVGTGLK